MIAAPREKTKGEVSTDEVFNLISRDEGLNGRRLLMGRKCGAKHETKRSHSRRKGEMR